MRLTASRIMFAPWPVFQSLHAGHNTLANESSTANWTNGSAFQFGDAFQVAFADGQGIDFHQLHCVGLFLRHFLERGAAGQIFLLQPGVFLLFQRIQFVKQPRRGETQRRARLAGGPHIHEAMQRVFLLLDAQFVARRARRALAATETSALIQNHRLDGGQQLRRCHQTHRHARAAEHGFDHFAVGEIRNYHAVLHRVTANDPVAGTFMLNTGSFVEES